MSLSFANNPRTEIFATLIGPNGQAATAADNVHNSTYTNGLQVFAPNPEAGTWRFVVDIINPVGGQVLSAPYTGKVAVRTAAGGHQRTADQQLDDAASGQGHERQGDGHQQRARDRRITSWIRGPRSERRSRCCRSPRQRA